MSNDYIFLNMLMIVDSMEGMEDVVNHIVKYANVREFCTGNYRFHWNVVRWSNRMCYWVRMSIRGTESNVGVLSAKIELDEAVNIIDVFGDKYTFRDGVMTDAWCIGPWVFDHAVSGLDFAEIAPVIAAEIERFMGVVRATGVLESVVEPIVVPMMLPLASIVGDIDHPQPKDAVVWYYQCHLACIDFVIATRGVFGLTSWLDVSFTAISHEDTNRCTYGSTYDAYGVSVRGFGQYIGPVLETTEVCKVCADTLREGFIASDGETILPEMYREEVISQILRVCRGMFKEVSYYDNDSVDRLMCDILGESYLPNVAPGIGVWD